MIREGPIRVLLIDDAAIFRQGVAAGLERCGDLKVVGCGGRTPEVRDWLLRCHPEVIVLDLDLPDHAAFSLLERLRAHYPAPLILAVRASRSGALGAIRGIERGAVDFVRKPEDARGAGLAAYVAELAGKVRIAALHARPVTLVGGVVGPVVSFRAAGVDPARHLIALGASTGGTQALAALLRHAPADLPPLVIVQHMPPGFTRSFAERLNTLSAVRVREAVDGEQLGPGRAVIARGDTHLTVEPAGGQWRVRCTHSAPVNRHRPSVDVLFDSVVPLGPQAVGVLLTGMGADGACGLLRLRQAGALTIAQDAASSTVYGMPKEAVRLNAAMHSAPPHEIPALVARALARRSRGPAPAAGRPR